MSIALKKARKMGAEGILGIGLNAIGQATQMNNTEHLMDLQSQNQAQLNKQMQKIQQENWDYTNYENQRKHMENAGLNVGLMYGGSGGGGATMGGGSGGSASGGNAPENKTAQVMGIGLQNEAIQSQIEVNKAEVVKKGAETKEIEARTPTYGKGMEATDQQIKEMATRMNVNEETAKKILQEIEESKSRVNVNEATIPKIGAEVKNIKADTTKTNAETNRINTLTPADLENVKADTNKKIEEVKQAWQHLTLEEQRNRIETFKAEIKAQYPNISEASGRILDNTINELLKTLGVLDYNENSKRRVR